MIWICWRNKTEVDEIMYLEYMHTEKFNRKHSNLWEFNAVNPTCNKRDV